MLKELEFTEHMVDSGSSSEQTEAALKAVKAAFKYFDAREKKFEEAQVDDFERYVLKLMDERRNSEETLVGLGRYIYFLT